MGAGEMLRGVLEETGTEVRGADCCEFVGLDGELISGVRVFGGGIIPGFVVCLFDSGGAACCMWVSRCGSRTACEDISFSVIAGVRNASDAWES